MKYNTPQIETMLSSMKILIDTREQETELFKKRVEGFKCPSMRFKLNYGDYSASYIDIDGKERYISNLAVVERKMNLDEVCLCFTKERARFEREFERAQKDGVKVYLLIENNNMEDVINGKYRSNLKPQSLMASLFAWSIRYNIHILFCKAESTGNVIRNILHYELREYLLNCEDEVGDE